MTFRIRPEQIREIVTYAALADKEIRSDFSRGFVSGENDYTSLFTGALRRNLNTYSQAGVSVTSFVLKGADERKSGCDAAFVDLLKALQPTRLLFDIAGKMFKDLWDFQSLSNAERIKRLKVQITKIDTDMSKLVDRLIETENALVVQKIEDKLEDMEQNKLAIVQKCENIGKPKRGYSEMFEHALKFLSSPCNIWQNGSFLDRRNVLKLAFTGQIPYTRENGFSNTKISLPFKVLGTNLGTEKVMAHWGSVKGVYKIQ